MKRTMYKMPENKDAGEDADASDDIRPVPIYGILFCGLILIITGIYLAVTKSYAIPFSQGSRYGVDGSRHRVSLTGPPIIIMGIGMCIIPIYIMIKQKKRIQLKVLIIINAIASQHSKSLYLMPALLAQE